MAEIDKLVNLKEMGKFTKENKPEIKELLGQINIIGDLLTFEADLVRLRTQQLLQNRWLLENHSPKHITIKRVREVVKNILAVRDFVNMDAATAQQLAVRKEALLKSLEQLDPRLGKRIRSQTTIINHKELFVLNQLIRAMQSGSREAAITSLRRNYTYYRNLIMQLEDKKLSKKYLELLHLLTGEEQNYIKTYLEDLKKWHQYLRNYGKPITFFSYRVHLYFYENERNADNMNFRGLIGFFHDEEVKKMLDSKEYHHIGELLKYQKQLQYIHMLKQKTGLGLKEDRWQDFERIYKNMDRHIKIIRHNFKNKEFADVLEEYKDKVKEQPEKWLSELDKLEKTLLSPEFQERFVIDEAIKELEGLFTASIKRLEGKRAGAFEEFKAYAEERITKIKQSGQSSHEKIKSIVDSREKAVERWLKSKTKALERAEKEVVEQLTYYLAYSGGFMKQFKPEHIADGLRRTVKWQRYCLEKSVPYADELVNEQNLNTRCRNASTLLAHVMEHDRWQKRYEDFASIITEPNDNIIMQAEQLIVFGKDVLKLYERFNNKLENMLKKEFRDRDGTPLTPEKLKERIRERASALAAGGAINA